MDNVEYRLAEKNDFKVVKELMLAALKSDPLAFSASFDEYNSRDDYWWKEYLNPFLFGGASELLLAEIDSQVVGSIGIIYESRERKKHGCTIVWFYVLPKYRGMKIGKSLIENSLERIKSKNILKVSLMANESQVRAIELYKSYHFSTAGKLVKEMFIDGEYYDVMILEKFLSE